MAVTHNFTIEQGSDFAIQFIFQDVNGNNVDLTQGVVAFRFQGNDSTTVQSFLSTDAAPAGLPNRYVTANNAGQIDIQFPAQFTKDLTFATATYELDFQPELDNQTQVSNTIISKGTIGLIAKAFNTFVAGGSTESEEDGSVLDNIITGSSADGDQCASSCLILDSDSIVYRASGIPILDNQDNYSATEFIDNLKQIQKIEVGINGLKHSSPQDLTFLLVPPTGDTVLLSSNSKISNYDETNTANKFNFVFSDRAPATQFIQDVAHNGMCQIQDKTSITKYSSHTLRSSFNHLYGIENTGVYKLHINDNDPIGTGIIDNWELIITYQGIPVTPSATPAVTPTVTPTITLSSTPTLTPTISVTPSNTPTVTPTVTPTISVTPTVTPTPGLSATPTVTPTPTATDCP